MHLFPDEIFSVNEGIGHLICSAVISNLRTPTQAFLICSVLHHQLSCCNFIVAVLLQSAIEVWQKSHLTLLLNIGIKVNRTCSGTYKKFTYFSCEGSHLSYYQIFILLSVSFKYLAY